MTAIKLILNLFKSTFSSFWTYGRKKYLTPTIYILKKAFLAFLDFKKKGKTMRPYVLNK